MGVMERVLSGVTRLSMELKFHTFCPDTDQEMGRMMDFMQQPVRSPNVGSLSHLGGTSALPGI